MTGIRNTADAQMFRGIGASEGIAVGRVFLLDRRRARVPRYHIKEDQTAYEIKRLTEAINKSVVQLEEIRSRFVDEGMDHQPILEAHEMMVKDAALLDEAARFIESDKVNAEWAISKVISRLRGLFDQIANPYLAQRRSDIDSIGDRILGNLAGRISEINELGSIGQGSIVVAHDLSPADTAVLVRKRVTAMVTEAGGPTSHTSIIARSMHVPAVVGVKGIFDLVGNGDLVVVDGCEGSVLWRPPAEQLQGFRDKATEFNRQWQLLLADKELPARTADGIDIHVTGNIEFPSEAPIVFEHGGAGIGLYRTEFLYIERAEEPDEELHYRTYSSIFEECGDRPVTIRTLDLGADKLMVGQELDPEPNPSLGLRGIRYCLEKQPIFETQIAGILRAAVHGNVRLLLPMVSDVSELLMAKALIEKVEYRLAQEGRPFARGLSIGCMIEVPSAVIAADAIVDECDFISIGTNDLIQYVLAIDRTNERVAYMYNPAHPAVLRTLKLAVDAASRAGVPVSICGEMAGDVIYVPFLLGFGVDQLSINAGSIPKIKELIRVLKSSDCRQLLSDALECRTVKDVRRRLRDFLKQSVPAEILQRPYNIYDEY